MNTGTFATTDNPAATCHSVAARARRLALVLMAATVLILLAGAQPATATDGTDGNNQTGVSMDDVVPDVVVGLPPGSAPATDPVALEALVDDLRDVRGVSWVDSEQLEDVMPRLLVGFNADAGDNALAGVESVIAGQDGGEELQIAGRAVADRELTGRFRGGTVLGLVLATLAGAAIVTFLAGWVRGLLAGLTLALSGWLATTLGSMAAGVFDGTVATTPLPGGLAAIVVSGYLIVRLIRWFENPRGEDQGEMIRQAVSSLATELVLFFASLAVVALFCEWLGPARSPATPVLVASLTATLLTLAVVSPTLAGLHGLDPPFGLGDRPSADERRLLPVTLPTGHDFPVIALVVFGVLLACLSLFGLQSTSRTSVLDERVLGDGGPSSTLASELTTTGDPTNAILARFPESASIDDKMAWLERVSQLTSVAWVDTTIGRYELGEITPPVDDTAADGGTGLDPDPPATADPADGDPSYGLIVVRVTGRSALAQDLVAAIETTNAPVNATLSGLPVDAAAASERDGRAAWATVLSLAAVGAVVIFTLIGDVALAALVTGLRLLGSASVLGVYHLLVGTVSGAELQTVLIVLALGVGLFELAYLQRLLVSHQRENTDHLIDKALVTDGRAAMIGLALVAVAGLGLAVSDLAVMRRLGIVVIVSVVLELVIGIWLLRPAVLGSRAVNYFASQPVRSALRVLTGSDTADASHQRWVAVVDYLLHAEFNFQAEAGNADLGTVYVPGTPVHQHAATHQTNLVNAGLRIVGRSPQLRSVRVVSSGEPVSVAVTVDHPIRQLVSPNGEIVGVRKPERRSVMLWLAEQADGSYRIADSVELGVMPLAVSQEPVPDVRGPVGPVLGAAVE